MAKTAKYIKNSLIEYYENKRNQMRCDLIRNIHSDFKKRHASEYEELDKYDKEMSALRNKLKDLDAESYKLSKSIRDKRQDEKIDNVSKPSNTCSQTRRHELIESFDIETEKHKLMILQADEITVDDVDEWL